MREDNFFSECWRCSLGNTHPAAPFIWLGLFIIALAAGLRWGVYAIFGLVGAGVVALSLLTTRGANRPATFWLGQAILAAVSLGLLGFAISGR